MSGRVIVVGSVNVDLVARIRAAAGAGETVTGAAFSEHDGGKGANQAVAAARLGRPPRSSARSGRDAFGERARACARARGDRPERARRRRRADRRRADPRRRPRREPDLRRVRGERGTHAGPCRGSARAPRGRPRATSSSSATRSRRSTAREALRLARAAGATTILNPAPATGIDRSVFGLADVLCRTGSSWRRSSRRTAAATAERQPATGRPVDGGPLAPSRRTSEGRASRARSSSRWVADGAVARPGRAASRSTCRPATSGPSTRSARATRSPERSPRAWRKARTSSAAAQRAVDAAADLDPDRGRPRRDADRRAASWTARQPGPDQAGERGLGRPPPAEQPRPRPERERDEEQRRLDEHDRRAGRDVEPVRDVEPDDRRPDPDRDRERDQHPEPDRQQLARRRRRHEHRDDEDDPDGLEADHDRQRDQREEQVLERLDPDARTRPRPAGRTSRTAAPSRRARRPPSTSPARIASADQVLDVGQQQRPEQEPEQVADVALDRAEQEHAERERARRTARRSRCRRGRRPAA